MTIDYNKALKELLQRAWDSLRCETPEQVSAPLTLPSSLSAILASFFERLLLSVVSAAYVVDAFIFLMMQTSLKRLISMYHRILFRALVSLQVLMQLVQADEAHPSIVSAEHFANDETGRNSNTPIIILICIFRYYIIKCYI